MQRSVPAAFGAAPRPRAPIVAGIPARDEADELEGCLLALAGQRDAWPDAVVLCLNNCTDDSADLVRGLAAQLPFEVRPLEVALPPERACAGWARRIAMNHAADLAGPDGIVLTTDADGRVAPDWLRANLAGLAAGADAVAGRAEIEPVGARRIPAHLHELDAQECRYAALIDEIASLLDPDPTDPWPRHDEHSGASIAVTVAAYRRAGGIPPVRLAEDRMFFDALRQVDARIRHAPDARVVVSARIVGRAAGGMADTMRRRMECLHEYLDDRLEPVADAVRRARVRVALRDAWAERHASPALAARLGVPDATLAHALESRYFGAAWAAVEAASPLLRRRPVPLSGVALQIARAERLRDRLAVTLAADQADRLPRVAAE